MLWKLSKADTQNHKIPLACSASPAAPKRNLADVDGTFIGFKFVVYSSLPSTVLTELRGHWCVSLLQKLSWFLTESLIQDRYLDQPLPNSWAALEDYYLLIG